MSLLELIFLITISIGVKCDFQTEFCDSTEKISNIISIDSKVYLRLSNSDPSVYWIYDTNSSAMIDKVSVDKLFPDSYPVVENGAAVIGYPEYNNGNNLLIVIGHQSGQRGYAVYRVSGDTFERLTDENLLSSLGLKSKELFAINQNQDTIGRFWPENFFRHNSQIVGFTFYPRERMYLFVVDDGQSATVWVSRNSSQQVWTKYANPKQTITSLFAMTGSLYAVVNLEIVNSPTIGTVAPIIVYSGDRLELQNDKAKFVRDFFNCVSMHNTTYPSVTEKTKESKRSSKLTIILVITFIVVVIAIAIVIAYCFYRRGKKAIAKDQSAKEQSAKETTSLRSLNEEKSDKEVAKQ